MKKVAFFTGQLFVEYQVEVTKALEEEAKKRGYQLDIFVNFGVYGDNFIYAEGEKSIMQIPYLEEYEGVILAADTFELPGFDEELTQYLKKHYGKPVINLRKEKEEGYSIVIDDVQATEAIVEHMITVHGFERICFVTGKLSMLDAQRRLQGYRNVMEKYHLPVTEHMIYEGDYWRGVGAPAVKWFLDQDPPPQAIVCSNDYMAISVCDALTARGIRIPEDIAVTGFDDLDEAKFYFPPITSMRVPTDRMGIRAIEILDEIAQGRKLAAKQMVPVHTSIKGSCGCNKKLEMSSVQNLLNQKVNLENTLSMLAYMSVSFDNADNYESLMNTANFYARRLPIRRMYICFNDQEELDSIESDEKPPYSHNMVLKTILGDKEPIFLEQKFERRKILPEEYRNEGESIYCVTFRDRMDYFGYIAMTMKRLDNIQYVFQIWLLSLADALGKLKMYSTSHELVELREKYEIDPLTGIGNRRRLEKAVRARHEKLISSREPFALLSIDMDDLKTINDTYGHPEGDCAITTIAHILDSECTGCGVAVRTGGDEYVVCLDTGDSDEVLDFVKRVKNRIDEENRTGRHEYKLSISVGYAIATKEIPLVESIKIADERMYAEKKGKKHRRRPDEKA